jgi:ubiquinone/menaquinone biosynthesis C-methylase UbiE
MSQVFHHFDNRKNAIGEIIRVLAPNGITSHKKWNKRNRRGDLLGSVLSREVYGDGHEKMHFYYGVSMI